MTTERITDLAISLKEDAHLTTPEDTFGTILSAFVITFKRVMSVKAMAQGMNLLAAHILENSSAENWQNGEKYPQGPEDFSPEMETCSSRDRRSGARNKRIACDVQRLDLTQICPPPLGQSGTYSRMITITETANTGCVEIVMNADDPNQLRFPGELTGGAVPPSREAFE